MTMIFAHFRHLLDFQGRENREPFWLWVLVIYVAEMIVGIIISVPMMMSVFNQVMLAAQRHPGTPVPPDRMVEQMRPLMSGIGFGSLVVSLIAAALVFAAVVRRLHDTDRTGWWALPVLILYIAGKVAALALLSSGKLIVDARHPYATMGHNMGAVQIVSLLAMLALAVVLALPGTIGPNRYGDDPLEGKRR